MPKAQRQQQAKGGPKRRRGEIKHMTNFKLFLIVVASCLSRVFTALRALQGHALGTQVRQACERWSPFRNVNAHRDHDRDHDRDRDRVNGHDRGGDGALCGNGRAHDDHGGGVNAFHARDGACDRLHAHANRSCRTCRVRADLR